jgi:hypothetical protein
MNSKIENLKKDLNDLILKSAKLYLTLLRDCNLIDEKIIKEHKERGMILFSDFKSEYEKWYSESLEIKKILLPDRLTDFISYYKKEKRDKLTHETYKMSDYLIGLVAYGVDKSSSIVKFEAQKNILESCGRKFESTLFNIKRILQADLFDTELDAAKELNKNGFIRAAGAMAGVILERHLEDLCQNHNLNISKKNPTISDFNDLLKEKSIIEIPVWRQIQFLADLRNLCDHNKTKEPNKADIDDMITGVNKIIKTI